MATKRLFHAERPGADLLIRGAHVLDPRGDLDEPHDVLIRDGRIAELNAPGAADSSTPRLTGPGCMTSCSGRSR